MIPPPSGEELLGNAANPSNRCKSVGPVYNIVRCIMSILHTTPVAQNGMRCAIFSRAMQGSSSIFEQHHEKRAHCHQVDGVEIAFDSFAVARAFRNELWKDRFAAHLSRVSTRLSGLQGWGEVVAARKSRSTATKLLAPRCTSSAISLAPALLADPIAGLDDLAKRLSPFRGHNMAKAGLELAYMDLLAQASEQSLSALIGGELERMAVGVSLGIQPTISRLLQRVEQYLESRLPANQTEDQTGLGPRRRRRSATQASRHPAFGRCQLGIHPRRSGALKEARRFQSANDRATARRTTTWWTMRALQEVMTTRLCLDESIISHRHARSWPWIGEL